MCGDDSEHFVAFIGRRGIYSINPQLLRVRNGELDVVVDTVDLEKRIINKAHEGGCILGHLIH